MRQRWTLDSKMRGRLIFSGVISLIRYLLEF